MKVTVCFDQVKVIVPCGDGDLSVEELVARAISRYKNATKKPNDAEVHVRWLETSEDNAILDKDDLVSDVCDDKDKLIAIYDDPDGTHLMLNGDGTSASSVGTNSPDSFQRSQLESKLFYGTNSLPSTKSNHASEIPYSRPASESLPMSTRQARPMHLALVGGDTQPRALKARPNTRQREEIPAFEESSSSSTPVSSPGHELPAPFDRNVTRKSISSAHPMLWNWIDSQEQYAGIRHDNDQAQSAYYEDGELTTGSSVSPNVDRGRHSTNDDASSVEIEITDETCDADIGLFVSGYKTSDGRELGLIINDIVPGSKADRHSLHIADRITAVNGISLRDKPNSEAEAIFKQAMALPSITLKRTRSHNFVSDSDSGETNNKPAVPRIVTPKPEAARPTITKEIVKRVDYPEITIKGVAPAKPYAPTTQKSIRIPVELKKGAEGLGFSLTSRDVSTSGGSNRVYVKNILSKGAAIEDGNLRTGDQLVEINGVDVSQKSQSEIVQMLRAANGLTRIVVVRQEEGTSTATTNDALSVKGKSPVKDDDGMKNEVFSLSIPLEGYGSAGLGVSVKGKTTSGDSPDDLGIYVKSVLKGGAAAKDGRLQADDQLLRINDISLVGMTNSEAMDTLRSAMQTSLQVGVIHIVMSRISKRTRATSLLDASQATTATATVTTTSTAASATRNELLNDEASSHHRPSDEAPASDDARLDRRSSKDHSDGATRVIVSAQNGPRPPVSPTRTQRDIIRNKSYFRAVDLSPTPIEKGSIVIKTLATEMQRPTQRGHYEANQDKTRHVVSVSEMPTVQQSKTIVIDRPFGVVERQSSQRRHQSDVTVVKSVMEDVRVTNRLQSPTSSGRHRPLESTSSAAPPSYEETLKRQYSGVSKPITSTHLANGRETKVRITPRQQQHSKPIINENMLSPVSDNIRNMSVSSQMSIDSILAGPHTMPFQRDAFGRLSMSERKGRAHLDATKTDFFNKIKKYKSMEELSKVSLLVDEQEQERLSPTFVPALTLHDIMKKDSLKRSESADTALSRLSLLSPDDFSPVVKDFPRGTVLTSSTPNYMQNSTKILMGRNTGLNSSFRSALEKANNMTGARQGDGGSPIPITMRSNAHYDKPKKKSGFFKGIGNMLKKNKTKRDPMKEDRPIAKTPPPRRANKEDSSDDQKASRRPKSLHEDAVRHEFTVKTTRKQSGAHDDQLKALQAELEKCRTGQPQNGSANHHSQTSSHAIVKRKNSNNNNTIVSVGGNNTITMAQPTSNAAITAEQRTKRATRPLDVKATDFQRTSSSHSNKETRHIATDFTYRPGSLPRQHAKRSTEIPYHHGRDAARDERKAHSDSRIGDSSTFPRKAKVKVNGEAKPSSRRDSRDQSTRTTGQLVNIADQKGITISHTAQV